MWFEGPFYEYSVAIILVLLIILLLYFTSPVFSPILWFAAAVFLPILFSTFLYYALRPLVTILDRWFPRFISILLTYCLIAIAVALLILLFYPDASSAIGEIKPENIETFNANIKEFLLKIKLPFTNIPLVQDALVAYLPKINTFLYNMAGNLISTLTNIAISLVLTPFVLFYFLRDDSLFSRFVLRFVPNQFQEEATKILQDIDVTLSEFILGQLTVVGVIGFFLLCGYLVIGLPHALLLALFAMIFYVIPILGTFIAIIPAILVALNVSLAMVIKVIVVVGMAHLLEINFITPRLMSQRLKIHPLTIILLLLAAGSLYGIFGLLIVTPTYAILKVIIWNLYKISRLRYAIAKAKAAAESEEVVDQN
ncbi:MAG: AI-2E family transporter [Parachlamydia sp.]|nr:AI-2E family transporter [Parachlamydia sp.]